MNILSLKAPGALILLSMLSMLLFPGCDLRDDRTECAADLFLRFEYTLNKNRVDLFTDQAECLDLYIYDESGSFVESVRASRSSGTLGPENRVKLTLPHGRFTVVAWANLNDGGYDCVYKCHLQDKRLSLVTAPDQSVTAPPSPLMHGMTEITVSNKTAGSEELVSMTKNSNKVTIVMNVTGNLLPVTPDDLPVSVTSGNGTYLYNNSILTDRTVKYLPVYNTHNANKITAEFTVLRLLTGDDTRLIIGHGGTKSATALPMNESLTGAILRNPLYTCDEDLDRYDEYILEYDIDISQTWTATLIRVNGWKVTETGGSVGH